MKEINREEIKDKLLKEKQPFKLEDYATLLEAGVNIVKEILDELQDEGYSFQKIEDYYIRSRTKHEGQAVDHASLYDKYFKFGIVADSHLASKQERLDALEAMYSILEREGVKRVYHVGDITDGWGVYKGHEFEVHKYGQQEQVDYATKVYPKRKGMITSFITGNHDLRGYERGGMDVGQAIARERKDLEYLGQMTSRITLGGEVVMELLHPDGPVAYALSYKAQRDINNRPSSDLPNILVYGHYHTSFYMHYRGIEFIQAPCFKEAGLWEKRKGLNPTIGGWIVEGKMNSDLTLLERFKPDLFVFENKRK